VSVCLFVVSLSLRIHATAKLQLPLVYKKRHIGNLTLPAYISSLLYRIVEGKAIVDIRLVIADSESV